ncbi:MAG: hypothetical protein Q9213_006741 [Squamulea squamosa]
MPSTDSWDLADQRHVQQPNHQPPGLYRAEGMIKNVNTIEAYRNLDKTAILTQAGRTIWDAIRDGTIYSCPSLLASFVVLSYADLKKYKFTYLFGFPALHSEPVWKLAGSLEDRLPTDVSEGTVAELAIHLSGAESTALVESVQTWRYGVDTRQYGFFLAKRVWKLAPNKADDEPGGDQARSRATTPEASTHNINYFWVVGSLANYETGFFDDVEATNQFVCFADPSTYKEYPGWMLRNLLVLIDQRWRLNNVQILCYRDIQPNREDARSMVIGLMHDERLGTSTTTSWFEDLPRVSGWERSATGKISSRVANLGGYMNPQRLADQAVDLNLKLIKWRIAPRLDLDIVKRTKCLLLGAGTLGSYVARNLAGVCPLFNFEDCLNGGAKKAHRAAEALREIYPGVEAEGHVMSVPMAGHPIIDEAAVKAEYDTLTQLIDEHDAIFLLMDTRESRWLPTVMGKAAGKIVMNAALGFDSFVVMRHGLDNPTQAEQGLGCYFCSDVVAPADSMADRTLDQQCTVTRPGIAAIASALLVEILVSVLQHPMGGLAPAPTSPTDSRGDHPLGVIPHQIRGFLSTFQTLVIRGNNYDCCSACSTRIVGAYNADGWQFVRKALNEKGHVEDLSGLAEVQRIAEKALADMDISDDSDVMDDDEAEII